MKNYLALCSLSLLFLACQPEDTSTPIEESVTIDLVQIKNDVSETPNAKFDSQNSGIYKGVFANVDGDSHGVLTINVNNNGRYTALLAINTFEQYGFVGSIGLADTRVVSFVGKNGSFDLNISTPEEATVLNATFKGKEARAEVRKSTLQRGVSVDLGSFITNDGIDPVIQGTWDFISTSTDDIEIPTGLSFPLPSTITVTVHIIDELVVMRNDGAVFNDTVMEDFTPGAGCGDTLPPGTIAPFYSGPQVVGGFSIDEYAASLQESDFGGSICEWTFNFSQYQGDVYYNQNCNVVSGGSWSWNGRSGTTEFL